MIIYTFYTTAHYINYFSGKRNIFIEGKFLIYITPQNRESRRNKISLCSSSKSYLKFIEYPSSNAQTKVTNNNNYKQ